MGGCDQYEEVAPPTGNAVAMQTCKHTLPGSIHYSQKQHFVTCIVHKSHPQTDFELGKHF